MHRISGNLGLNNIHIIIIVNYVRCINYYLHESNSVRHHHFARSYGGNPPCRQFSGACSQTKRSWLIRTNTGTRNYLLLEYILCTTHRCSPTYCTCRRDIFSSTHIIIQRFWRSYYLGGIHAARQRRCLCLMSEMHAMFMAKLMARTRAVRATQWDFSPYTKHHSHHTQTYTRVH